VAETAMDGGAIVEQMLDLGFFLRSLGSHRAGGSLVRITVGDAAQNRRCLRAFRQVLGRELPADHVTPTPLRVADGGGLSVR
jgi:histidinol-phosphate/aromatic aminotransferase/cobyric acid decarboxylase-like protein